MKIAQPGNSAGYNDVIRNQKEKARIQLQAEEYDLMAATTDLDEIKEVNANCILMANLQQASTSGAQTDNTPVYDIDGSAKVHEICDDNEIFNMFTQEEQYTELLEPIPKSHQVPQNDNDAISEDTSVEQGGETVEQHPKSFLIPNEDLSDDTTPSVPRKFLNEVKSTNVTLQRVVKQRMTIETHNWSSSAHQELHKIIRDESFPIVNQVDARVQNFKIQFLKEAAKFVGDFKSLAKEADDSFAKHKALELEFKRLLKAVVSQDIMIIVQNESVVDTSDLQTKLEHTKERFENYTRNPLSQKLKNKNVELEFKVLNYARENANLKATYKNLFDSISVSRAQTKIIIASLQNELQSNIYKSAKLKTQLFKKVSDQKDNTQNTSENTKFAKQPIVENLPKVGEINALSKPVTSNSVSTPQESKGVNNDKTRRPQPRSNIKNDRVPSASKSSRSKNKGTEVEEHHRNLLLSKNKKHMLSACNNFMLDSQNVYSKVVCAMCKQCLISVNHDECLLNYVNDKNSCGKKQSANVSIKEKQKKRKPKVKKPKKVESHKSLATPTSRKPRCLLRWSPTGRMFDINGKIIASNESESQSDCSKGDNACTSNPVESTIKRFSNATFSLAAAILGFGDLQWGNILITMVYFIEGLGHNLFSVGQFYDSDLEVAFRRNACFIRNLKGVDLLKGDHSTNLYTINLHEMASASPICLMARASSTKSWL
nr:integrase, catalytic region, zinc finger, CCHC-type, peptidase aspartic, catalytic [Tanacetum cinerariifolium]